MKHVFLTLVTVFLLTACTDKPKEEDCTQKCDPNVMCTLDFRWLNVQVETNGGQAVVLDTFSTVREEDNKTISVSAGMDFPAGTYPLFSDGEMEMTDRCGKWFYFTGYLDGKELVKEKYYILHDCCHVKLEKGSVKLVVP